ncbi:MAG: nucleoside kinase [Synergistaceae bacterium]|jgi:uridine kinase|nr:nucleoside kinase [Synergistaceae bacterium]
MNAAASRREDFFDMAFTIKFKDGKYVTSESPLSGRSVMAELGLDREGSVAWRVNNYVRPLEWVVEDDADAEFITTQSKEGLQIYRRSLDFLFVIASEKALGRRAVLRHSIGEGHYWEFEDGEATQSDVYRLHAAMNDMVRQDLPIIRKILPVDKARRIFEAQGEREIADLFVRANLDPVEVYRCGTQYGYFCCTLAPSAGLLKYFELLQFSDGIMLQFPTEDSPDGILPFRGEKALSEVFVDYARWLKVLDLNYLSSLHRHVAAGKAQELILIAEAFHSQRLSRIAEEITSRPSVKAVTIAGPSGSGKTTFSERLKIQLIVCGKRPVTLPLDNYFLDRDQAPRDENGEYNYEILEALDLELLEDNLARVMRGEEVVTPHYDFAKGVKVPGKTVKLGAEDILIIEGIHGLNDRVLGMLPEGNRFSIFVSPLTGICIDPHNRTSTGDNRLLRRIVRDYRTRGKSAEVTLEVYPKVMRGARRYIFPFQSRADTTFNSALPYELAVLKSYAEPVLHTVRGDSPMFTEAVRLLNILKFVPSIQSEGIPNNSVIREFIGGSCLDV